MNQHDRLYDNPEPPEPFCFNEAVATVFPNMIQRSVPGYSFCLTQIKQIALSYSQPNSTIFDLGCSLGAITLSLREGIIQSGHASSIKIQAIDSSPAMIQRAKENISAFSPTVAIELHCEDIIKTSIENASIVVLAYTLQFIELNKRKELLRKIFLGLKDQGVFILIEKTHEADNQIQNLVTNLHHEFKRNNGYSELEIAQKRQALENVLITETCADHEQRMREVGFKHYTIFAKHLAFTFWIAIKA
ncbi:carboxy-S-adenosyl-L-methionine synthase CmoA [Halothiobacillus sp. DCM-1]|uniref:carboxy-S-adenosyl-L-methionine synthase CmoA n=1 Tax=Halothiobacillus sp. DCM-1 TaxID=3112558 RepID=UPI0032547CEC